MILRISKVFGSRVGATEITVTKRQFLAMSENLTNVHANYFFTIMFAIYSQFGLSLIIR